MNNNASSSKSVRHRLLLGFTALFVVAGFSACGGGSPLTLTQANLDKIQPDMSTMEVKAILGDPTESKTEPIPIVGGTKTTYTYENNQAHVVIVFKNDKEQTKEGTFGAGQ